MPLVKQGKFKEYYNSCEKIKKKLEKYHSLYFDENDYYNCNKEIFSEFFYDVDDIYIEALSLKTKLEDLIKISEQKTEDSIERCNNYIADMEHVIEECKSDFKKIYDSFNGNFSDLEMETLKNYKIYHEI